MDTLKEKWDSLVTLVHCLDPVDFHEKLFMRSLYLSSLLEKGKYTSMNDGGMLPWDIELLFTVWMYSLCEKPFKEQYYLESAPGKKILSYISQQIDTHHEYFQQDISTKKYLNKLYFQQFQIQRSSSIILYRCHYIFNSRISHPNSKVQTFGNLFSEKMKFTYDELLRIAVGFKIYFQNDIDYMNSTLPFMLNELLANIELEKAVTIPVNQIIDYQNSILEKSEYDWLLMFKFLNVYPFIFLPDSQKPTWILPHRTIYSLLESMISKFTIENKKTREYLGPILNRYLNKISLDSGYFDEVMDTSEKEGFPDSVAQRDDITLCFEMKASISTNVQYSLQKSKLYPEDYVREDIIQLLNSTSRLSKPHSFSHMINNIDFDKTYMILVYLDFSIENIENIIDSLSQYKDDTCFDKVEYIKNHLVVINLWQLEDYMLYMNTDIIKDIIRLKSKPESRFYPLHLEINERMKYSKNVAYRNRKNNEMYLNYLIQKQQKLKS